MLSHRLATVTAAATFALILAGGLVTSTGSALAVPDWPTTFGYSMILYPWSQMVGGVLYEHSHRLLGALVGLLTVALAAGLWVTERRGWVRALGAAAVALVVAQGVLGGLRVVLVKDTLAIVHGALAPAFFALTVVIAVVTSRRWREPQPVVDSPRLRGLALGAVAFLYLQIVFGALLTHAGRVDLHLAGAAAVFVFVPIVTARARAVGQRAIARSAFALLVLLGVQFGLGLGAYLARFSTVAVPGGHAMALALPVAHRLVAALMLGSAATLVAWLIRARPVMVPTAGADPVRRDVPSNPRTVESAP